MYHFVLFNGIPENNDLCNDDLFLLLLLVLNSNAEDNYVTNSVKANSHWATQLSSISMSVRVA